MYLFFVLFLLCFFKQTNVYTIIIIIITIYYIKLRWMPKLHSYRIVESAAGHDLIPSPDTQNRCSHPDYQLGYSDVYSPSY